MITGCVCWADPQVRLPLLPVDFLTGTVAKEEMIKGNLSCRDLLDEARNYHLHLSNKVVPDFEYSVRTTPRKHTAGGPRREHRGLLFAARSRWTKP